MSGVDLSEPGEFRDLRDLAIREVVQLLDEHESVRLESAFAHLTPDQQAEILDLQAAVAREINAAGEESPDRSLRYKVLARVAEAIESDTESVAPIASIGRRGSIPGFDSNSSLATITTTPEERGSTPNAHSKNWSMLRTELGWRAAALVFGASLLVLGLIHWRTTETLDRFERYAISEIPLQQLIAEDPEMARFEMLLRSSTRRDFPLAAEGGAGSARIVYEPATNSNLCQGLLVINQIPEEATRLRLLIRNSDGIETTLMEGVVSNGHVIAYEVALDRTLLTPDSRFVLMDVASGEMLLESRMIGA